MISWQYIAGFFDGEGSISPGHDHVAMYQKDPKPLLAIQEWLRANDVQCSVRCRKTPRKTNFLVVLQESTLQIDGHQTEKFCRGVIPYLQTTKKIKVQDYLRFRTMYPKLTAKQASVLGQQELTRRGTRHKTPKKP